MPVKVHTIAAAVAAKPQAAHHRSGRLTVNPRFAATLAQLGLTTAEAVLDLPGEVVSGHPDRHVMRVELPGRGGALYLKRQHRVGWRERLRQRLAGFGWASRCEREANLLRELEADGFPCPAWVAHGEDGRGRAFLLVEELAGAVELRRFLGDIRLSSVDRARLAERLGQAVAELHAAGFATPDLTAKHAFVNAESFAVILIDWQSARRVAVLRMEERVRALAALDASLADGLTDRRERLRFLWAYRRVTKRSGSSRTGTSDPLPVKCEVPIPVPGSKTTAPTSPPGERSARGATHRGPGEGARRIPTWLWHCPLTRRSAVRRGDLSPGGEVGANGPPDSSPRVAAEHHSGCGSQGRLPRFSRFARAITALGTRMQSRRSIRDQRQPAVTATDQRLVWLAGEAVCAAPDVAAVWPSPAVGPPFYGHAVDVQGPIRIRLADGRPAELLRGTAFAPLGRFVARVRGRPWRSPGVTLGRVLFHLQRYGVLVPRLLAFGQRETGRASADWFALYEPPAGRLLAEWVATSPQPVLRREVFARVGRLLRQLHDAGCRYTGTGPLVWVADGNEVRVMVGGVRAVRIVKRLTDPDRAADLRAFLRQLPGLTRIDRRDVARGYEARNENERS